MNKTLIKQYYRLGIYSEEDLDVFVKAGYITGDEVRDIMENTGA